MKLIIAFCNYVNVSKNKYNNNTNESTIFYRFILRYPSNFLATLCGYLQGGLNKNRLQLDKCQNLSTIDQFD